MNKLKHIGFLIIACLLNSWTFAQDSMNYKKEDPTDFMRSEGKIYVVVAVIVTIVIGIYIYLINLDKKISRLEKSIKNRPPSH